MMYIGILTQCLNVYTPEKPLKTFQDALLYSKKRFNLLKIETDILITVVWQMIELMLIYQTEQLN